ncbi:MAG TPA: dTMP kinase [Candidatus Portnoybacteria bacterium]|uniref:Thymidylate kinase n=1 Tax=Candidatus Portnoybacteria bacterium CG02_land_8_20_14_3_00_45_8 TaxID=1974807 RepID=A0A2M7D6D4_9BACT|nr:MAG: dTMP kinase [Candidatus Portnoybacteria bacterium CG02_land_8_20_14_3_00_45_8]HCX28141.1 dTMP kinase [Candidatus Portnoybacteria bacterium]
MKKNSYGGLFIVFEGLDGSGQSTQAALLKEYFLTQSRRVFLTKEPTLWTKDGRRIKEILDEKESIAPLKLQELFVADRAEHLAREIIPALRQGIIVICDRYFFSTIAFGGLDTSIDKLVQMNDEFIYPDQTFFLRVRPEVCMSRINRRGQGAQFFEKMEKLQKIAQNYGEIIKIFSDIKVIDGEKSIKEIHQKILSVLADNQKRRE